jgi:ADP-heptose:LPS heptosyltransferase
MAGGGPLLTDEVPYDSTRHVAANLASLVERALDLSGGSVPVPPSAAAFAAARLALPERARAAAGACLEQLAGGKAPASLIALHAAGGREIKQWPAIRFAESAVRLARDLDATVLLTGGPGDAAVVDEADTHLRAAGIRTVRLNGTVDLVILAGILAQCRLLLTGDTGPMHLAAAVGTPVLAVFGPSMPWRYAPLVADHRIVRVDLPCSPCNRIRQPPARCVGHVPDCLVGVTTEAVIAAGRALLASAVASPRA